MPLTRPSATTRERSKAAPKSAVNSPEMPKKSALCLIDGMLSTAAKACRRSSWSGQTAPGDAIAISGEAPVAIDTLRTSFERWLPDYMGGKAA